MTPGFSVTPGYLSADQEETLANCVRVRRQLGEGDMRNGRYTARYGYDYAPKPRYLGPVPEAFVLSDVFARFDALVINMYEPGAVLNPHVDNQPRGCADVLDVVRVFAVRDVDANPTVNCRDLIVVAAGFYVLDDGLNERTQGLLGFVGFCSHDLQCGV